jgi:hypothetical protein
MIDFSELGSYSHRPKYFERVESLVINEHDSMVTLTPICRTSFSGATAQLLQKRLCSIKRTLHFKCGSWQEDFYGISFMRTAMELNN